MKKVVVSEYLQPEFLDHLQRFVDVVYDPDLYSNRADLLRHVSEAEALFTRNRTQVDNELLTVARKLQVVGRLGVGLDNIDMGACGDSGVRVIPAVGANAISVAEYVLGAMLVLSRGVFGMTDSMLEGAWPRQGHAFGRELMGKTMGLVGFGSIARQVAIRAQAFEMEIVAYDPFVPADDPAWRTARRVTYLDLLAESDVISIHTALTDQTEGMIDRDSLARCKRGALLINTSRGGIVDEEALASALREGSLGGAALDVFATEPLGKLPAATFAGIDNLILTPHVAGNTDESVHRVAKMIVGAVLEALEV